MLEAGEQGAQLPSRILQYFGCHIDATRWYTVQNFESDGATKTIGEN